MQTDRPVPWHGSIQLVEKVGTLSNLHKSFRRRACTAGLSSKGGQFPKASIAEGNAKAVCRRQSASVALVAAEKGSALLVSSTLASNLFAERETPRAFLFAKLFLLALLRAKEKAERADLCSLLTCRKI